MTSGRTGPTRTTALLAVGMLTATSLSACGGKHAQAHGMAAHPSPTVTAGSPTPTPVPPTPTPTPTTARPTPTTKASPTTSAPVSATGLPPVLSKVPTSKKVVFITIDDGWEQDQDFVDFLGDNHIPITVFLLNDAGKKNYGYFRRLQQLGNPIEDHSMTHPLMTRLSYATQKWQICQTADIYAKQFGTRPTLFRAPYGAANLNTRKAAKACGMKAIFFWRETSEHGDIAYQTAGGLQPGDIILVHFEPHMTRDFRQLLRRIYKQGFQPAALHDYLPSADFS